MDADLKAEWVAALRSGEFKQGKAQLRYGASHCCLGVLAVVANIPIGDNGITLMVGGNPADYKPLDTILGEKVVIQLYRMNDEGFRFPQIADYIEANL